MIDLREIADFSAKMLDDSSKYDRTIETIDNKIFLYSSPKYKGLAIKVSAHPGAKESLLQESRILESAENRMKSDRYKTPKILYTQNSPEMYVIGEERIYGNNLLKRFVTGDNNAAKDVALWLKEFNGEPVPGCSETLGETIGYKQFMEFFNSVNDKHSENIDFKKIRKLLTLKSSMKIKNENYILHGDCSPIHLFDCDDRIYGIDFNGTHIGTKSEEAGYFVGNLWYHMCNNLCSKETVSGAVSEFIKNYDNEKLIPEELNFYIAGSYLKKAVLESGIMRDKMISKARELLEAKDFSENYLFLNW